MSIIYVDVREANEFSQEHINGSINSPLSKFENAVEGLAFLAEKFEIKLVCKTGMRSSEALSIIKKRCEKVANKFSSVEGGMANIKNEDGQIQTISGKKSTLPIMRQVLIVAGILVLTGVLLAKFISPNFIWFSGAVGAGLLFAGISGICMMSNILAAMPWNK